MSIPNPYGIQADGLLVRILRPPLHMESEDAVTFGAWLAYALDQMAAHFEGGAQNATARITERLRQIRQGQRLPMAAGDAVAMALEGAAGPSEAPDAGARALDDVGEEVAQLVEATQSLGELLETIRERLLSLPEDARQETALFLVGGMVGVASAAGVSLARVRAFLDRLPASQDGDSGAR